MIDVAQLDHDARQVSEFAAEVAAVCLPGDGSGRDGPHLDQPGGPGPPLAGRSSPGKSAVRRRKRTAHQGSRRRPTLSAAQFGDDRKGRSDADSFKPGPGQSAGRGGRASRTATGSSATPRSRGDLVASLDAVIGEWSKAEINARLARLDEDLDARTATLGGLLNRLVVALRVNSSEEAENNLDELPGKARAAIGVVRRIAGDLEERSGDPDVWNLVGRWCEDWLRAFELAGRLTLGEAASQPAPGTIEELFPLHAGPVNASHVRWVRC